MRIKTTKTNSNANYFVIKDFKINGKRTSKLKTLDLCKSFLEQPIFEYQHILKSLIVLTKENDFIQSELYKNSLKYSKRNDKILFFCKIEVISLFVFRFICIRYDLSFI